MFVKQRETAPSCTFRLPRAPLTSFQLTGTNFGSSDSFLHRRKDLLAEFATKFFQELTRVRQRRVMFVFQLAMIPH